MNKTMIGLKVNKSAHLVNCKAGKEYYVSVAEEFRNDKNDWCKAEQYLWEEDEEKTPIDDHLIETFHNLEPEKAMRFNTNKPQLSFLLDTPKANKGVCAAFSMGAKKYARGNWKKGLDRNEITDSLLRHLQKSANGEVLDDESEIDHLYHVAWNALVLAEQYAQDLEKK